MSESVAVYRSAPLWGVRLGAFVSGTHREGRSSADKAGGRTGDVDVSPEKTHNQNTYLNGDKRGDRVACHG